MTDVRFLGAARLVLVAVASFVWVGSAHAESHAAPTAADLRIAAERFDEGRAAFKVAAYAEAAEHFEAADARAPSSSALGLAMRSRAEAGHLQRAATLAELALRRYPDDSPLVEKAKAIVGAARVMSARLVISCSSECDLVVDEKLIHGRASEDWTLYLEPGSHTIAANWPNDVVATQTVSVRSGESRALGFSPPEEKPLPPVPVRVPPPADERVTVQHASAEADARRLTPTAFWIGVGATVVLGGAAVWSGIDTLHNPGKDAVRQGCVNLGESCDLYREGQRHEMRTDVLIGTSAAFAIATLVTGLFYTDFSSAKPAVGKTMVRLRPWADAAYIPPSERGSSDHARFRTVLGAEGRF
jgi:hypothetical protein